MFPINGIIQYSHPSISMGYWFQASPQKPTPKGTQVPYIKWWSTVNTVGPAYVWFRIPGFIQLLIRRAHCMWYLQAVS